MRNVCQTREKFWTNGCARDMCRSEYYFTLCNRLRAVPPFPSCDRVLSMEEQATRRMVLLSPCSLRGLCFRALYTITGGKRRDCSQSSHAKSYLSVCLSVYLSVCLSVGVHFFLMSYHLEEGFCYMYSAWLVSKNLKSPSNV